MFRQCLDVLSHAAGQRMRSFVRLAFVGGLTLFLTGASVVVGAFGFYGYLKDTQGAFPAAMTVCAALALASLVCLIWLRRRLSADFATPGNVLPDPAPPLPAPMAEKELMGLAIQAGQSMTASQTIALALVAGILAGRNIK